jgi:hypothetical protein
MQYITQTGSLGLPLYVSVTDRKKLVLWYCFASWYTSLISFLCNFHSVRAPRALSSTWPQKERGVAWHSNVTLDCPSSCPTALSTHRPQRVLAISWYPTVTFQYSAPGSTHACALEIDYTKFLEFCLRPSNGICFRWSRVIEKIIITFRRIYVETPSHILKLHFPPMCMNVVSTSC